MLPRLVQLTSSASVRRVITPRTSVPRTTALYANISDSAGVVCPITPGVRHQLAGGTAQVSAAAPAGD
jgi:hypothetical protein